MTSLERCMTMLEIRVSSEVEQGDYQSDLHLVGLFMVEACHWVGFRGLKLVVVLVRRSSGRQERFGRWDGVKLKVVWVEGKRVDMGMLHKVLQFLRVAQAHGHVVHFDAGDRLLQLHC